MLRRGASSSSAGRANLYTAKRMLRISHAAQASKSACIPIRFRSRQQKWRIGSIPASSLIRKQVTSKTLALLAEAQFRVGDHVMMLIVTDRE